MKKFGLLSLVTVLSSSLSIFAQPNYNCMGEVIPGIKLESMINGEYNSLIQSGKRHDSFNSDERFGKIQIELVARNPPYEGWDVVFEATFNMHKIITKAEASSRGHTVPCYPVTRVD